MTQDPHGQAQGTGSVVRGEVVPDDSLDEEENTGGAQDPSRTEPGMYGTPIPALADSASYRGSGSQAAAPAEGDLRPGESDRVLGDFSDLTYGSLLPDTAEWRARWQQIQFKFVDDPQGSVTEAADIIAQVTVRLEAAIAERQRVIAERQGLIAERQRSLRGRWGEGTNADTETLRETLQMYRAFLDQLTGAR